MGNPLYPWKGSVRVGAWKRSDGLREGNGSAMEELSRGNGSHDRATPEADPLDGMRKAPVPQILLPPLRS